MTAAHIVFFDIAGPEAEVLRSFYSAVFDWEFDGDLKLSVPVTNPLEGAIREDPPEKRLYIGVEDIAATLEDIVKNGGSVDAERLEVAGVVVLGLFRDPAGNPLGLVEMQDGQVKVP
jgi:predicted enzyme related to lactoylglutathione lyase